MQNSTRYFVAPRTAQFDKNPIVLTAVLLLLAAAAGAVLAASQPAEKYPPTVVFMTDFGVVDDAVAICRGVMYSVMPSVRVVDLT